MDTVVRLHGSCDACLQSKVKCSKGKPSCRRCAKNDSPCVYSPYQKIGRPSHKRQARDSLAVTVMTTDPDGVYTRSHAAGPRPLVSRVPSPKRHGNPLEIDIDALSTAARSPAHSHPPSPSCRPPPIGSQAAPPRDDAFPDATMPDPYVPGLGDMSWEGGDYVAATSSSTTSRSREMGIRTRDPRYNNTLAFQDASSTFSSVPVSDFDMSFDTTQFTLTAPSLQTSLDTLVPDDEHEPHDGRPAFSIHTPSSGRASEIPDTYTPGSVSPGAGPSLLRKGGDPFDAADPMDPFQLQSLPAMPNTDLNLFGSSGNGRAHDEHIGAFCVRQCCLRLTMCMYRLAEQASQEAADTPSVVARLGRQIQTERDVVLNCGMCMRKNQREQTLMLLAITIDRFLPLLTAAHVRRDTETRDVCHRLLLQQFRAMCKLELAAKGQSEVSGMSAPYAAEIIESVMKRIELQLEAGMRG